MNDSPRIAADQPPHWFAPYAAAILGALAAVPCDSAEPPSEATATGKPTAVAGPCFVVRSFGGGPKAEAVLTEAERLRNAARRFWLAETATHVWRPRCEVIIHARRDSYLRSVGSNGRNTSGACLIERRGDRITRRRIDLLVAANGGLPALPHELTHVVIADCFGSEAPPAWVDEGVATLADTEEKQALHRRDCRRAIASGATLPLKRLLRLSRLGSREQAATFYGQSLSLVDFLMLRGEPEKLLPFVRLAERVGYDEALQRHYGIHSVAKLERLWRDHTVATMPVGSLARSGQTD